MSPLLPIDDIAIDWINDKLYWADATLHKVEVMDLTSGDRKTLFDTGVGTLPRGIAVDPSTRWVKMFGNYVKTINGLLFFYVLCKD